jgi:hypothetical protein
LGKADALEEETGKCTPEAAGVKVQASGEGFARRNVGKVLKTSSGWSKLQRLINECKSEVGERLWDWHMWS